MTDIQRDLSQVMHNNIHTNGFDLSFSVVENVIRERLPENSEVSQDIRTKMIELANLLEQLDEEANL